ncbi:hypothetical protein M514_09214 [Trichuris suis]|uniref:Uncharacterized protein n=1 Tax=Trichuris suis TaxID=68888 RepID=A0A085LY39_9BILA|nr:hypothetical protein M513_09214 [Trichuris suis]KFD70256.1 hypothetical protein M514_09214 [Trichuris suis]KHJ40906.1 hypothetical protein D918_09016 [Trichuris suis]
MKLLHKTCIGILLLVSPVLSGTSSIAEGLMGIMSPEVEECVKKITTKVAGSKLLSTVQKKVNDKFGGKLIDQKIGELTCKDEKPHLVRKTKIKLGFASKTLKDKMDISSCLKGKLNPCTKKLGKLLNAAGKVSKTGLLKNLLGS